ncbi:DUF938 domain-containing protein [Cognatilysobacter bugurensis]|nr:DUF938 domain-containing protein [Lysobacter bugurensis]
MHAKPHAPSCDRNRDPILDVLREHFAARRNVLEIGSGTGQHAVHFAAALPQLQWQCSDVAEHLPGIAMWLDEAALPNTPPPVELDVARGPWPSPTGAAPRFDAAFTANTLHIMGWPEVQALFAGLDRVLDAEATLIAYGPFNVGGAFTSESNAQFDAWLRDRDPRSGVRDLEAVDALAQGIGMTRIADVEMPAHNRCLVWTRSAHA